MMAESVSEMKETYRPNISSYDSIPAADAESPTSNVSSLSIFSGKQMFYRGFKLGKRYINRGGRTFCLPESVFSFNGIDQP